MGKTLDKIISKWLIIATGLTMGLSSARSESYTVPLDLPTGARTLNMVRIPAGSYWMGNIGTLRDGSFPDELPQHEVTITKDFYIGETEITQAQYFSVVGVQPANSYGVGDNYPVYYVSWNDTQNFINDLNELSQDNFRLPTEAEWEYACRGSESNPERYNLFSFGDDTSYDLVNGSFNNLFNQFMVWNGNNNIHAEQVASRLPNDYGLYDMHGNMWEWIQDFYREDFYSQPEAILPNPINTLPGNSLMRGGSWTHNANGCRTAERGNVVASTSHNVSGFRIAIDASEIDTPTPTETETSTPTETPTLTPYPTYTFYPTSTPYFTNTPRPTYTPNHRADLIINGMRLTTEFNDCNSRDLGLEVEVENVGNNYAGPFTVKINDDFKDFVYGLAVGTTGTVWSGSDEINLNYTQADFYNQVLESNEGNNSSFEVFHNFPTPRATCTPTITETLTRTNTPVDTQTPYPTYTERPQLVTQTPYNTNTPYPTYTFYPTWTEIPSATPTETFTMTPTFTESNTPTFTFSYTPTYTTTPSPTETNTLIPTLTNTPIWNYADLDGNGVVNSNDVLMLLQEWHKHRDDGPVLLE